MTILIPSGTTEDGDPPTEKLEARVWRKIWPIWRLTMVVQVQRMKQKSPIWKVINKLLLIQPERDKGHVKVDLKWCETTPAITLVFVVRYRVKSCEALNIHDIFIEAWGIWRWSKYQYGKMAYPRNETKLSRAFRASAGEKQMAIWPIVNVASEGNDSILLMLWMYLKVR